MQEYGKADVIKAIIAKIGNGITKETAQELIKTTLNNWKK